jgi:Family of unknown function (DUF6152)
MTRVLPLALACLVATGVAAHHGSADYDVGREVTITGTVKEFRWSNPHVWVYVTAQSSGSAQEWNGEGPPLQWASSRGWSATTLQRGQVVRLIMYPSRREPRAGLIKRIERDGSEPLVVSRPWLGER